MIETSNGVFRGAREMALQVATRGRVGSAELAMYQALACDAVLPRLAEYVCRPPSNMIATPLDFIGYFGLSNSLAKSFSPTNLIVIGLGANEFDSFRRSQPLSY